VTGCRLASSTIPTNTPILHPMDRRAESAGRLLLKVTVLGFLVFLFLVFLFFDRLQFEGIHRHNLKIGPALGTRHDFTFVDLIFFDVEVALTFGTINHECLRARAYPDNI
jgi:hypothetical protein